MERLLQELCEAAGVNGVGDVTRVIAEKLAVYVSEVHTDRLGNVWGVRPAVCDDAPTLLLEAHMDEIGFIVTEVTPSGFLRVSPCGGTDARTLAAQNVTVLCEPPLSGVFCSTPPHLAGGDKGLLSTEERGIDVGLPADEVKARVPVGTRVMFAPHFDRLLGDRVCSKALDDRAGCAALLRTLELLEGKELPCRLVVLFSVQEELGTRGAAPAAFGIQPDAAIAVDVSFAHTPDADRHACGVLGGGVMLGISPILDGTMTERLRELSTERSIPLQFEVMGGTTGTDADKLTLVREGIPTALLSIPLRYMHTPNEVASLGDIEAVASLMAAFAQAEEVCDYA